MISEAALWASLPIPAVLVDRNDIIIDVNGVAEMFLNASAKSISGTPVWDRIAVDAPLEDAFARARTQNSSLFVNNVDVGTGNAPPMHCNLQIAPIQGSEGDMLFLFEPQELASRVSISESVKNAAKSAIGMAEMLAHEIKNSAGGHHRCGAAFVDEPQA